MTQLGSAYTYAGGCEISCSPFSGTTSLFCCQSNFCNSSTKQRVPITIIALSFAVVVIVKLFQIQAV